MKTTPIHLLGLALLPSAIAIAQEPAGNRPPPVPPLMAVFDTDRDGVISAKEITDAATALATLDQNGDGKITPEEMRPPPPEGEPPAPGDAPKGPPPHARHPLPPVIVALDSDKNGSVSAAELRNSPVSLKQLDKNADGELSIPELLPIGPPPPRGGPPDGADGPQGPPPPPPDEDDEPASE